MLSLSKGGDGMIFRAEMLPVFLSNDSELSDGLCAT